MEEVGLHDGAIIWSDDEVRIRYKKIRKRGVEIWNRLRQALGELRIPVHSLHDVELEPHTKEFRARLTLTPREGACPFHTVAGGTIEHPDFNPFHFFLNANEELIVEYYVEELRAGIVRTGLADVPAERPLIQVPHTPKRLIGGDGRVTLNRDTVTFEFNNQAEPEKIERRRVWTVPISSIESVSWEPQYSAIDRVPFFQIHLIGAPEGARIHPFYDINALLLYTGPGEADGLIFAAALHERLANNRSQPAPEPLKTWLGLYHPHSFNQADNSLELLKDLASLRAAGIITEEEFQVKKKQILDRL
ncbi:DUF4429 domain-containing protein [Actinomadura pelletieri]|nr:DUF4429 domain-containing protein [Actinomadura pelletieri]